MPPPRTVDLGLTRDRLEHLLHSAGYWGDAELTRRNGFVLSPSAYVISAAQWDYLNRLAGATFTTLRRLSERLTRLATQATLSHEEARFLALARSGTRGLLTPKEAKGAVPPIVRLDLVQARDGRYLIAEVDAYNPRGLGYLALVNSVLPQGLRPCGLGIEWIARLMKSHAGEPSSPWFILISEFERYYQAAFMILANDLRRHAVRAKVMREHELTSEWFHTLSAGTHILMIPESMHANPTARRRLLRLRDEGTLASLYPSAAYLGSKAFLPFFATDEQTREFVPRSALVSRQDDPWLLIERGTAVVIKGAMSSGMKDVAFSDIDSERFNTIMAQGRQSKRPLWVMQEEVPQTPATVAIFAEDGSREVRDYFLRITAHISQDGVVGVRVTGRPDKRVHGAHDAIQLPSIEE